MITHVNENNNSHMVDVGEKSITKRIAIASGTISMNKDAFDAYINNTSKKGPVEQCAVVAGVMAAKNTSHAIPMCHNLNLNNVEIVIKPLENGILEAQASVSMEGKTGVEMEALHAVSISLLTIYDMLKALDKGMKISNIKLLEKRGGKSGIYKAEM
ncbi:cyclic pyranopterin monophosphate synthase MoaC [Helicobacter sp. 11S02629-2]|uniref:cyclic pyranopterin monophosphate synthase MoaC n=1 Tax=Helicobacter sp. 11S02629-2 TaxID=1476195 RepID=UPI000BA55803|nr:cyclic pyranopterin monophosphate synthase MoaC [Helicobacter sp. 11S02629-2]PAF44597.1 molybdenum cofactor biosynthesis protein C [Helicobacter sp. 11S02629-2]